MFHVSKHNPHNIRNRVKKKVPLVNAMIPVTTERHFSKKTIFGPGVIKMNKGIAELLRRGVGGKNYFNLGTPVVGFPSPKATTIPTSHVITAADIATHKNSGDNNDYFFSTTVKKDAKKFGPNTLIIDVKHPIIYVNVDRTFFNARKAPPGYDEAEYAALAVPLMAIKSIMDQRNNEVFNNPFYLPINPNDQKIIKQYEDLLEQYYELLAKSNPDRQDYNKNGLVLTINSYVYQLIKFYGAVLKENSPFNLTLPQFAKLYPKHAKEMSKFNHPQFSDAKFFRSNHSPTMELGRVISEHCASLFLGHSYIGNKKRC